MEGLESLGATIATGGFLIASIVGVIDVIFKKRFLFAIPFDAHKNPAGVVILTIAFTYSTGVLIEDASDSLATIPINSLFMPSEQDLKINVLFSKTLNNTWEAKALAVKLSRAGLFSKHSLYPGCVREAEEEILQDNKSGWAAERLVAVATELYYGSKNHVFTKETYYTELSKIQERVDFVRSLWFAQLIIVALTAVTIVFQTSRTLIAAMPPRKGDSSSEHAKLYSALCRAALVFIVFLFLSICTRVAYVTGEQQFNSRVFAYYATLMGVQTDATENSTIPARPKVTFGFIEERPRIEASGVAVIGDWVYFVSDKHNKIYRYNLCNKDRTIEAHNLPATDASPIKLEDLSANEQTKEIFAIGAHQRDRPSQKYIRAFKINEKTGEITHDSINNLSNISTSIAEKLGATEQVEGLAIYGGSTHQWLTVGVRDKSSNTGKLRLLEFCRGCIGEEWTFEKSHSVAIEPKTVEGIKLHLSGLYQEDENTLIALTSTEGKNNLSTGNIAFILHRDTNGLWKQGSASQPFLKGDKSEGLAYWRRQGIRIELVAIDNDRASESKIIERRVF